MTMFDDPNREAVGLAPIWTGAGEPEAEPEPELRSTEPDEEPGESERA